MEYDVGYYRSWLNRLERRYLEVVDIVLKIDQELQQLRKLLQPLRELDEYDNFILGSLLFQEIHFRKLLSQYRDELEEIELDLSHTRFMIERLTRSKDDV